MKGKDIIRAYAKSTNKPVMANGDWCKSWSKNHKGQNCEESQCPHASHCKGLSEVFIALIKARQGGK